MGFMNPVSQIIAGATTDPIFGPVILFGRGGTAVEVIADRAVSRSLKRPVQIVNTKILFPDSTVHIEKADLEINLEGEQVVIEPFEAVINGGAISGRIVADLGASGPGHALKLTAKDFVVDHDVARCLTEFAFLVGEPFDELDSPVGFWG